MALLVTILFWVLLAALAVAVLLLVTPVHVRMRMATVPETSFRCDLRALGGLMPRVTVYDSRARRDKKPRPGRAGRPRRRKPSAGRARRLLTAAPRFLGDILHAIHFKTLHIACEYGLNDPADTGQLSGVVMALTHGLPPSRHVSIVAVPNFQRLCFSGEVTAVFHLTLAAFLLPILRFAWRAFGTAR